MARKLPLKRPTFIDQPNTRGRGSGRSWSFMSNVFIYVCPVLFSSFIRCFISFRSLCAHVLQNNFDEKRQMWHFEWKFASYVKLERKNTRVFTTFRKVGLEHNFQSVTPRSFPWVQKCKQSYKWIFLQLISELDNSIFACTWSSKIQLNCDFTCKVKTITFVT